MRYCFTCYSDIFCRVRVAQGTNWYKERSERLFVRVLDLTLRCFYSQSMILKMNRIYGMHKHIMNIYAKYFEFDTENFVTKTGVSKEYSIIQ